MGGKIILVGEGDAATFVLDPASGAWSRKAVRPFQGDHHSVEVIDGRFYLFGGLHGGSEGRVQIYDPVADQWELGAPMPYPGGSVASALIAGKVYVAGGIVNDETVPSMAIYDPLADEWSAMIASELIAPMPVPVNHAAAATDGRRLFIFGGRSGYNVPSGGFDAVQIFDPATNSWQTSGEGGSLMPLPVGRGGMGKAVFMGGEFYVIGGETFGPTDNLPGGVYDRVDVYSPDSDTWRAEAVLPTARHGLHPLVFNDRIWTIGGGVVAGFSRSAVTEIFAR